MKKSSWTFLYVPEGDGGVRTMHVEKRLAWVLAAAVGLFVLASLVVTVSLSRQRGQVADAERREEQVQALRSEIARLEESLDQVEEQVAAGFQLQERASIVAGLGPLESGVVSRGVGGQAPMDSDLAAIGDRPDRERLAELREHLDRLRTQASSQNDGFEKLLTVLREDQELRDSTPSTRPMRTGWLSSRYGKRVDPFKGSIAFHSGLDFSAQPGTPIYATASGKVQRASKHGSLGNLVEIDHGNGFVTRYGHMRAFATEKGKTVERGEVIGYVGSTGRSTNPHLHYEVVRDGRSQNPWLYIIRD